MNILFIGCGLIGGSIAKALVLQKNGAKIYTLINNQSAKSKSASKPAVFEGITFFTNATQIPKINFEIICIATPRGKNFEIYTKAFEIAQKLSSADTQIVDISSVQNQNEAWQKKISHFTPCHPIAGTEKTGFENSSPQIIAEKKCIVISKSPPKSVIDFWHAAGMQTVFLPCVQKHDEIFAKISHLPQLISFNMQKRQNMEKCEGFDEFYRLKNSPLEIWQETFLHNKLFICTALQLFKEAVLEIKTEGKIFGFEKTISNAFLNFTNHEEKTFAGSGFKSITSAFNAQNSSEHGHNLTLEVIEKCKVFLETI